MFGAIILPIFRSTRLCVTALWYNAPTMLPAGELKQARQCPYNLTLGRVVESFAAVEKL